MYKSCLLESISFTLKRNTNLFDDYERQQLDSIISLSVASEIQSECCSSALTLISRMILRKHEWLKSSSFSEYLISYPSSERNLSCAEVADSNCILSNALRFLLTKEFIDVIDPCATNLRGSILSFEALWSAVEDSFSTPEIVELHRTVANGKCQLSRKSDILNAIRKIIATQKNVLGLSLRDDFHKLVIRALKRASNAPSIIVRVKPSLTTLLRRVQRLYQVRKPAWQ